MSTEIDREHDRDYIKNFLTYWIIFGM